MIIAISGSSGFIGKHLCTYYNTKGYELRLIPRIQSRTSTTELITLLKGVDVIINLAGASSVKRCTVAYKKVLKESRCLSTRKIVEAISMLEIKPQLLISASAIGIYSQEGQHTETNCNLSDDYLGEICRIWESEAKKAMLITRVVIIRFGIVLGKDGGILKRLLPVFKLGLGGRIASGNQVVSWIHIYDVIQAIQFIIDNRNLTGEFNLTTPNIVSNRKFTKVLANTLNRPAIFTIPAWVIRMIYGKESVAIAGGQYAFPEHLLNAGFHFTFPTLVGALDDITE